MQETPLILRQLIRHRCHHRKPIGIMARKDGRWEALSLQRFGKSRDPQLVTNVTAAYTGAGDRVEAFIEHGSHVYAVVAQWHAISNLSPNKRRPRSREFWCDGCRQPVSARMRRLCEIADETMTAGGGEFTL